MLTKSKIVKLSGIIAILAIVIPTVVFALAAKTPQSQPSATTTTAIKIYMTVQGVQQGDIEGESVMTGHTGEMDVLSMHHQVISPPEARVVHGELRITKNIDKASPKLALAMIKHENLVQVVLKFYRPSSDGTYLHYYTIKLEDAMIVSIESHAMDNGRHMEEVSFNYLKITWIDVVHAIEVTDDLTATVA